MKRVTTCHNNVLTTTLAIALFGQAIPVSGQTRDAYTAARHRMVEEMIAAEGVANERVLESVRTVPRHLFVRPALRPQAYEDTALDIGQKQTISPPFIVAYMTEMLDPQPTDVVLEIGTGSGYQAAVLSSLVKDVYTIEIVEPLGKRADALLKSLKYGNVHTRIGDGYLGWPEHAPFDKIIVTCSPEKVPAPLVEQLREGGKMIVPLGERYQQVFYLLEKKDGKLEQTRLLPALFVPMTGKAETTRTVQPDPLHPHLVNGGFEEDVDENLQADGWHWHRRAVMDVEQPYVGKSCLKFENDQMHRTSHILQAFAVDGAQITNLDVTSSHRQTGIRAARDASEQPGIVVHFFDGKRLPIAHTRIGPWLDDEAEWRTSTKRIPVPREAREAIIQLGLNGSTGTLCVDEVSIAVAP
jgi:protein-L-isoaspartate(D-aspartate) O-methyltransferase